MFCCVCSGSCNHVGPHSYCDVHRGNWYTGYPPVTYTTNTNFIALSDEDVDRIADRIIEKLTKNKKLRK